MKQISSNKVTLFLRMVLRYITEHPISSNFILISEDVENHAVYCLILKDNGENTNEKHSIVFKVSKSLKCGDNIEITLKNANKNCSHSTFNVIYGFGESSVIACKIISEINDIASSSKISYDFIKSLS